VLVWWMGAEPRRSGVGVSVGDCVMGLDLVDLPGGDGSVALHGEVALNEMRDAQ
jgi:hypothetical protein